MAKRLGENLHSLIEMTVVQHRVLGVARDEQDLQFGVLRADSIGKLAAVQTVWQADIGD